MNYKNVYFFALKHKSLERPCDPVLFKVKQQSHQIVRLLKIVETQRLLMIYTGDMRAQLRQRSAWTLKQSGRSTLRENLILNES